MAKTVFTDGNPQQGIQGTIVTASFLNKLNKHRHRGLDEDGDGAIDYAADTGQTNQYEIALTPVLDNHVIGMPIRFKAANTCTGASTFKVDALDPVAIKRNVNQALESSDIVAGQVVCVVYDGTYYQLINISIPSDARVPAGAIVYFPANTPPTGYVKANGALLSRTTYAALWAFAQASGNIVASDGEWTEGKFSPGDGSTTFRIPDERGNFIRGWDDSRGIDPGRAIGSFQADALKAHEHTTTAGASARADNFEEGWYPAYDAGAKTGSTGDTETRPRNTARLACIKY